MLMWVFFFKQKMAYESRMSDWSSDVCSSDLSIDVFDSLGSNVRVDSRGMEVLRVLPRINEEINEEWISDKTRFACDGLSRQRLDRPYVRRDGKLRPASWDEAFAAIAARVEGVAGTKIAAVAGDLADCESMLALHDLMTAPGSPHLDCRQDGAKLDPSVRAGYVFNSGIAGIEAADAILLVGTNPRLEAPVLNARIRKRWMAGGLRVGVVGPQADLTYRYDSLGAGSQTRSEEHTSELQSLIPQSYAVLCWKTKIDRTQ